MTDTSKLFSDKSDIYARARPTYPDKLFNYIKELIQHHNAVWDCATGNGQAALGLSKVFKRVYATDISDAQIEHHLKIPAVEFSVCPAEKTDFADNSFDLVNVAQALHWFDFERFWPEVKRVLKPGGAFITYSYGWFEISPEIDALVQSEIMDVISPYWAPNNLLAINGYRDVAFPFKKLDVPDSPILLSWTFMQMMDYLHTWSATRRCMDALGDRFFYDASEKIALTWGDVDERREIIMPMVIVAGYP